MRAATLLPLVCLVVATMGSLPAQTTAAEVRAEIAALATTHPDRLRVLELARTRAGTPVDLVIVGEHARAGDANLPAALIVAGLSPDGGTGVRAALEFLTRAATADPLPPALVGRVVFVVPLLAPELHGSPVACAAGGVMIGAPDDLDRDRARDEDGWRDVDGDGVIAWMAIPDSTGDWRRVPDPIDSTDTRVFARIDRQRGEVGTHRLEPEADDADGDGLIAEDGPGSIDPFRAFPTFPLVNEAGAGPAPLWEPEARALIDFLLPHRNLDLAFVLTGPGDAVLTPLAFRPYDQLPEPDRRHLERLGDRLREASKLAKREPAFARGATAGTLLDWLAWEHGAFAWQIAPAGVPKADADRLQAERKQRWQALTEAAPAGAPPLPAFDEPEPITTDRLWLAYLGETNPDASRPWKPFAHPQYGAIEIGGLPPMAKAEVPAVPAAQIVDGLLAVLPSSVRLEVRHGIRRLDKRVDSVFEVVARVANVGDLPTASARSQATRRAVGVTAVLAARDGAPITFHMGARSQSLGQLDPGSISNDARWLVEVPPGTVLVIEATSERGGHARIEVSP